MKCVYESIRVKVDTDGGIWAGAWHLPGPSLGAVLRCRQPVALHAHMFYINLSFVTLYLSFVLLASVVHCFSFSVAAEREIVREMTQGIFRFST